MKETAKSTPSVPLQSRPIVVLLVVLTIIVISMGLFRWEHTQLRQLFDTKIQSLGHIHNIHTNVLRSYLINEQVQAGNTTVQPSDALAYIEQAHLELHDFTDTYSTIIRNSQPDQAARVDQMLADYDLLLTNFATTEQSILAQPGVQTAAAIDLRILFSDLNNQTVMLEALVQSQFAAASEQQEQRETIAILTWSLVMIVVAITMATVNRSRNDAITALETSAAQFKAQYQGLPVPTYTWQYVDGERDFILRAANQAAEALTPGSLNLLIGAWLSRIYAERPDIISDFQECFQSQQIVRRELEYTFPNTKRVLNLYASYVFVPPDLVMVHAEDRTEHNQLETQLRRSQKLEGIGRLAGGIAHDFNNLLTAISGYVTLARDELPADNPLQEDLVEIGNAANRATQLTSQLLAFARKQTLQPNNINLNDLLTTLHKLLRRVLPEHISMTLSTYNLLGTVYADPGQIEQVLLNLVINARDAMPNGGHLYIETSQIELDETYVRQHVEVQPGHYALLSVSDTGHGMSKAVQQQAFEPFFTTKGPHRGTGLGLAMCFGIIKQHHGHIEIYSEEGHGTSIKIYLPLVDRPADAPLETGVEARPMGSETILVTEDEEQVRSVLTRMLRNLGYNVLEAVNGVEAFGQAELYGIERIDLLITDMVMPELNGQYLAALLRRNKPQLKVLYISGYAEGITGTASAPALPLLTKPFTLSTLAQRIRSILDAPDATSSPAPRD